MNITHLSSTGEKIIKVTSTSGYSYEFTVSFMSGNYVIGAEYHYLILYFPDCPNTDMGRGTVQNGAMVGVLDMLGPEMTRETSVKHFGISERANIDRWIILNITGSISVPVYGDYKFYMSSSLTGFIEIDGNRIIDNSFLCPDSYKEYSSDTISLTPGYHEVILNSVYGEVRTVDDVTYGGWAFDFAYECITDASGKKPITLYYTPEFQVANSLFFLKSSYAWGKDVRESIEFTVNGADRCLTEPELPSEFKILTDEISGVGREVNSYNFLVKCESPFSVTNIFNITIDITDVFLPGLIGYYMKYDDFPEDQSRVPDRNLESSHLHIMRLEEDVRKGYYNDTTIWPGLGSDFQSDYGVVWEGSIHVPTPGSYTFEVTCDDACWLFFDHSQKIAVYPCLGTVQTRSTRFTIREEAEDHIHFRLDYLQYKFASYFDVKIKGPNDNELHYPEGLLFYSIIILFYRSTITITISLYLFSLYKK